MDFTREPIIETVVTPREGCKLVVRSSKSTGQEEYFVDAVEIVSFGHSFFFRSLERPKMFFVPATDYEILEVREARMVLKNVAPDRTIKIAGGREPQPRQQQQREREQNYEKIEQTQSVDEEIIDERIEEESVVSSEKAQEPRVDRKKERRRQSRRRRGGREDGADEEVEGSSAVKAESGKSTTNGAEDKTANPSVAIPTFTSLLPPPSMLISDTIARYRDSAEFKDAFYLKEEQKASQAEETENLADIQPSAEFIAVEEMTFIVEPTFVAPQEVSQEQEDQIYLQRKTQEELPEVVVEHPDNQEHTPIE